MLERYFDNAATTPIDPRVVEAMLPWISEGWGNAHSIHEPGRRAMAAVENARAHIGNLLGCEPEEVFFTSGATESNNWTIRGFEHAVVSPVEHSSVREPAIAMGHQFSQMLGGRPMPTQGEPPDLQSTMLVNNEVGSIYPLPTSRSLGPTKYHSDITQAVGKIAFTVDTLDLASFSAHKFYGPKGIGGLYAHDGETPPPLLIGGEQEHGRRGGTLNVAAIVGMGEAAKIAADRLYTDLEHAAELRSVIIEEIADIGDFRVNGSPLDLDLTVLDRAVQMTPEPRSGHMFLAASPYILSISFRGVEGETLVVEADQAGFAISAGAACSSRSAEPSHVLTALGLEDEWLRGTIRISFGRFNTKEVARDLGQTLRASIEKIRRMG